MPRAAVLGLGISGLAAARLLQQRGWQVGLYDAGDGAALHQRAAALRKEGFGITLGALYPPERPDLAVVSPGIPWDHPVLQTLRDRGVEVIGEVELAYRHLPCPWVGITGTNGKTTTTALTAAIFQSAGLQAPSCGNIGTPTCALALQHPAPDWAIAELSSYQIEGIVDLSPQIGIWTTLTPDHLERHGTLERYYTVKARLLHAAKLPILNGDDPFLAHHGPGWFPHALWTSTDGSNPRAIAHGAVIRDRAVYFAGEKILTLNTFNLLGDHNRQNLLLAVAAACKAGIAPAAIAQAVSAFRGVPHRLEQLGTCQQITWINDSKATNYDAAEVALRSVSAPVILIAGGRAKAGDPGPWLAQIRAQVVHTILFGEAAPFFAQLLTECGSLPYNSVDTLASAVEGAWEHAQQFAPATILFSPACASFDQFANFEQRGDSFRSLCQPYLVPSQ
ncbi:MAG: UDP-N-acetylmuramoyl-L-alanine--D-glutamate ligase [Oscillatoriales cyanobacterium SM2_2_1]|nr:UDP-N-acetylmuramoyl-L-alanine--D-glutamate ligase [Oscillatoriales cyanobacterium SM2_2_1]